MLPVSASAANRVNKYHSSFSISIQLGPNPTVESVEKTVWEILQELKDNPLSPRELKRVKNQVAARSLRKLRNLEHLATELAYYQMWGTWEYINIFPESIEKVTALDVLEICNRYFHASESTVGILLPEENPEP